VLATPFARRKKKEEGNHRGEKKGGGESRKTQGRCFEHDQLHQSARIHEDKGEKKEEGRASEREGRGEKKRDNRHLHHSSMLSTRPIFVAAKVERNPRGGRRIKKSAGEGVLSVLS